MRTTSSASTTASAGTELRGTPPTSTAPTRSGPDRLTLTAFGVSVLIGGTNFVAVRFSNRELDPFWGAGSRFALAALLFAAALVVMRLRLPRGRALRLPAAYGLLSFGAMYGLLYWGMQEVPAGVAAVVLAAGPLLTLLLAAAHRLEALHLRAVAGAVVVLVGSALMFLQPGEATFGGPRLAAICLAALAASESVVLVKRSGADLHPVVMNVVGMSVGAVALLAVSAASGERWAVPREPATMVAFTYLVLSTVALFVLVLLVIRRWTASATSYLFVLMPPVAVTLGAALGGEPVTTATVLGGLVVMAGVYVGALRRRGRAQR